MRPSDTAAATRLAARGATKGSSAGSPGRVGVVDIGSNTVRLVVYDAPLRLPVPIYNEKTSCRLAKGLEASGRLNADGADEAMRSLARFTRLADAMGVER
ncbi:MAG TPA: Ppx/GppA family phosphatase, partial [Rhodospirillales bacterium]